MEMIDENAVREHIRGLILAIGEDPEREGLKETPQRVARMYEEIFKGIGYSNHDIAKMYDKTFEDDPDIITDSKQVVLIRDIGFFSYCEHHMALMYDLHADVAYIPNGRVIGISKIARICDMVGKRLQLQERIGRDIADIMEEITGSSDVGVSIEGCHSCMTSRGINKINAKTCTLELRGSFKSDPVLQKYLIR